MKEALITAPTRANTYRERGLSGHPLLLNHPARLPTGAAPCPTFPFAASHRGTAYHPLIQPPPIARHSRTGRSITTAFFCLFASFFLALFSFKFDCFDPINHFKLYLIN